MLNLGNYSDQAREIATQQFAALVRATGVATPVQQTEALHNIVVRAHVRLRKGTGEWGDRNEINGWEPDRGGTAAATARQAPRAARGRLGDGGQPTGSASADGAARSATTRGDAAGRRLRRRHPVLTRRLNYGRANRGHRHRGGDRPLAWKWAALFVKPDRGSYKDLFYVAALGVGLVFAFFIIEAVLSWIF